MLSTQLAKEASKDIKNFIGVFPLDQLPASLPYNSNFIVNTDTANLPGKHWIAVSYDSYGIASAFDPAALTSYLAKRSKHVYFNELMVQDPRTPTCGQHCLKWLRAINKGM